MPTIVGILTFMSIIDTTSERLKARNFFNCPYFSFYIQLKFTAQLSWAWNISTTSGPGNLNKLVWTILRDVLYEAKWYVFNVILCYLSIISCNELPPVKAYLLMLICQIICYTIKSNCCIFLLTVRNSPPTCQKMTLSFYDSKTGYLYKLSWHVISNNLTFWQV